MVGGTLQLYQEFCEKLIRKNIYDDRFDDLEDVLHPPTGPIAEAAWRAVNDAADAFATSVANKKNREIPKFKKVRHIAITFIDAVQHFVESEYAIVLICIPKEHTKKKTDPKTGEKREVKTMVPTEPSLKKLLERFFTVSGRDADFEVGAQKSIFQKVNPRDDDDEPKFIKELSFDEAYKYAKEGGKFERKLERIVENGG